MKTRLTQWSVSCALTIALAIGASAAPVWAYAPATLYDDVWKLINTRFVDGSKNGQDWNIWRNRYDDVIKTNDDAFVAIETMLASLNDRYTRFLTPDEFAEEGRSIRPRSLASASRLAIGMRSWSLLRRSKIPRRRARA